MSHFLNTLYVTTGGLLRLDHETVRVEQDGKLVRQVPLQHLGTIVVIGGATVTPQLMQRIVADGGSLVYLTRGGRFMARVEGPVSGNVLLRRAQHAALSESQPTALIARGFIAGKLQNARQVLLRGARECEEASDQTALKVAARVQDDALRALERADGLPEIRGIEGGAAAAYFSAFTALLRCQREDFAFTSRTRHPPRDCINALLSFAYTLLRSDCAAALESVGLDPQVGYLHALRSGRPALALDLMEELRPLIADRLALTLVNRRQLRAADFEEQPGGAVWLGDAGRRTLLVEYQKRKQAQVQHGVLKQKIPLGLVPHAQARLLARHLRGDIPFYPAYTSR